MKSILIIIILFLSGLTFVPKQEVCPQAEDIVASLQTIEFSWEVELRGKDSDSCTYLFKTNELGEVLGATVTNSSGETVEIQ